MINTNKKTILRFLADQMHGEKDNSTYSFTSFNVSQYSKDEISDEEVLNVLKWLSNNLFSFTFENTEYKQPVIKEFVYLEDENTFHVFCDKKTVACLKTIDSFSDD